MALGPPPATLPLSSSTKRELPQLLLIPPRRGGGATSPLPRPLLSVCLFGFTPGSYIHNYKPMISQSQYHHHYQLTRDHYREEPNVSYECRWDLQLFARGKALHRVSHAHAALFVTAGEKARLSRMVGLPASARRRSCRRSQSQSRRHRVRSIMRGRECAPRCPVRGPIPRSSWFAPCDLLPPHHRRCCCSVVCWLRRARPPRSSACCAEPDGALVAA